MTSNGNQRAKPLRTGDPQELGGYRIVGRLGRGGMGTVYLATDSDGRNVALKLIHPDLSDDEAFRRRFAREVESARRVARFSTAAVLDAHLDSEPLYIVSEYVPGPNLAEAIEAEGPMYGGTLESLAMGVAAALAAIHGAGVIHRDLKPANVLLSTVGPKVIDFGIARALEDDNAVTRSSQLMGTPAYLAPELILGQSISPGSDLFSWGCLVAFAGTGKAPFDAPTVPAVLHQISTEQPNLEGLDPTLREVVIQALDKQPENRPSAQAILDRLVGHSKPSESEVDRTVAASWTPPAVVAGAAGVAAGAAASRLANANDDTPADPTPTATASTPADAGTTAGGVDADPSGPQEPVTPTTDLNQQATAAMPNAPQTRPYDMPAPSGAPAPYPPPPDQPYGVPAGPPGGYGPPSGPQAAHGHPSGPQAPPGYPSGPQTPPGHPAGPQQAPPYGAPSGPQPGYGPYGAPGPYGGPPTPPPAGQAAAGAGGGGRGKSRLWLAVGAGAAALLLVGGVVGVWLLRPQGPPEGEQLVYTDDFSDDGSGWASGQFDFESTTMNGGYTVSQDGENNYFVIRADEDRISFSDSFEGSRPEAVMISTDAIVPVASVVHGWFGMHCFRLEDDDDRVSYYEAVVALDGSSAEIRRVPSATNEPEVLASGTPSDFTAHDMDAAAEDDDATRGEDEVPEPNSLTMVCEPNPADGTVELKLWVNDRLTVEAVDSDPLPDDEEEGRITGLNAHRTPGSSEDVLALFDRFDMYRLETPESDTDADSD